MQVAMLRSILIFVSISLSITFCEANGKGQFEADDNGFEIESALALHTENVSFSNFSAAVENFLENKQSWDLIQTDEKLQSCKQYLDAGHTVSGVYMLHFPSASFPAFCFMSSDNSSAWTVLQRRTGPAVQFWNATFDEYAKGFGNPKSDHWLGLDRLRAIFLTAPGKPQKMLLRILIFGDACPRFRKLRCGKGEGKFWWGDWSFAIAGKANGFQLNHIEYLQGNLTTRKSDPISRQNHLMKFSTGAKAGRLGGWWHGDTCEIALNGEYTTENSRARGQTFKHTGPDGSYHIKPYESLMLVQI